MLAQFLNDLNAFLFLKQHFFESTRLGWNVSHLGQSKVFYHSSKNDRFIQNPSFSQLFNFIFIFKNCTNIDLEKLSFRQHYIRI